MNDDVRDISQKVIAQREMYRPKNIQESYFSAIMSDILLIYYAVDETSKIANGIEAKTDKAIDDLKDALIAAKNALDIDVTEAKDDMNGYISKLQSGFQASLKISTDEMTDKLDKKINSQVDNLLNESEKKIENDVSAGKK